MFRMRIHKSHFGLIAFFALIGLLAGPTANASDLTATNVQPSLAASSASAYSVRSTTVKNIGSVDIVLVDYGTSSVGQVRVKPGQTGSISDLDEIRVADWRWGASYNGVLYANRTCYSYQNTGKIGTDRLVSAGASVSAGFFVRR